MIAILIAAISGTFVIASMIMNANLAKHVGVFQGTLINYIAGLIGMLILMGLYGDMSKLNMAYLHQIPVWAFAGGLCGVVIVASMNIVIPKIPAVYTTLLLFIGQITVGLVIDYVRFDNLSIAKLAGVGLVLIGITYNNYVDQKLSSEGTDPTSKLSDEKSFKNKTLYN